MTINAKDRHPKVQELVQAIQADKKWTGKRRAMGQVLETFVKDLLRDFEDSTELISALEQIVNVRRFLELASLDPHKVPSSAMSSIVGKTMSMSGGDGTTVTPAP